MKRDQDASRQQEQQGPWKMKRFQSVESKVSNNLRAGGLSDAGDGTSVGQRKMTKAEQMKLRMQQERGASDYVGSPPQNTNNKPAAAMESAEPARPPLPLTKQNIQMENIQQQRKKPPMPGGAMPPRNMGGSKASLMRQSQD